MEGESTRALRPSLTRAPRPGHATCSKQWQSDRSGSTPSPVGHAAVQEGAALQLALSGNSSIPQCGGSSLGLGSNASPSLTASARTRRRSPALCLTITLCGHEVQIDSAPARQRPPRFLIGSAGNKDKKRRH